MACSWAIRSRTFVLISSGALSSSPPNLLTLPALPRPPSAQASNICHSPKILASRSPPELKTPDACRAEVIGFSPTLTSPDDVGKEGKEVFLCMTHSSEFCHAKNISKIWKTYQAG